MKTLITLLISVGILISSISPIYSNLIYQMGTEPNNSLIYDINTLPWITSDQLDGTEEILGVTPDGVLIIRYKGKVYIFIPNNLV